MQYAQDYDETLPWFYIGNPGQRPTWYDKTYSYIGSTQVVFCPSDKTRPAIVTTMFDGRPSPNPSFNWNPSITGNWMASPPATKFGIRLSGIKETSQVLLLTPIQSNAANPPRTLSADDYTYGLTHSQLGIIDGVARHLEGENWLFCDGHAKFLRLDQVRMTSSGKDLSKQAWWDPAA